MKKSIVKRFDMYWRLELLNIILIPAMALYLLSIFQQTWGWILWFTYAPMALLLLMGGLYWRAKWLQAKGDRAPLAALLPWARRLQAMLLALTLLAVLAWVFALSGALKAGGQGELAASGVFALLAVAEYINYYLVQLQHFDHAPDFSRLVSGRGFRKSHLKRDLEGHAERER